MKRQFCHDTVRKDTRERKPSSILPEPHAGDGNDLLLHFCGFNAASGKKTRLFAPVVH
jgi:hypothetical protein